MRVLEESIASEVIRRGGTEVEVEKALQGLKIASVGAGALGLRAAPKPSLSLPRPRRAAAASIRESAAENLLKSMPPILLR